MHLQSVLTRPRTVRLHLSRSLASQLDNIWANIKQILKCLKIHLCKSQIHLGKAKFCIS